MRKTNNKHTNKRIKRPILFTALLFAFALMWSSSVSALDISQQSLEITEKSDTTIVHDAGISNLHIAPNLEFNRLNDFISYKLVIKNNDGKKYRIVGITDDNSNEAIALTYSYPTEMDTNDKAIDFTIKYIKVSDSPFKTINVTIKIVDEDDASEIIPILVPRTGIASLDTVSLATIQTTVIYIAFAALCFTAYLIVRHKRNKEDERVNLRIPKVILAATLLLGLLPVVAIAVEFENVRFTINLTEVKLNGPYTITFDTEGGSAIPPQTVNNGEKIIEPTDLPEKNGYSFEAWVDENGDPYDFDTPVTGPVTLHTKWKAIDYTITYNLDGGSVSTANPTTYNIETDTFTLNNPTREHYDFVGWTGTDLTEATKTVKVEQGSTGDRSYAATWKKKKYTATFNTDGGSPAIDSQTKEYNDTFIEPTTNVTKKGYHFDGWLLNGAPYNFDTPATANIELKAKWNIITYNIDYDLDGGSVATANPTTYTVETDTFTLSNPTKEGYEFDGWVDTDDNEPNTTIEVPKGTTGDLTFEAEWTPINYSITYTGGGTAEPANKTTYNIETLTFELTNPTKDGYVFTGWTGSNGDTPQLNVSVAQGTTGDLTYTANWNKLFAVTYDVNGGSAVSPASFKVENGKAIGALASTNKDHYDFAGWFIGDNKVENDYIVRSDITIKAKWTPTNYNIYYVLPDGAVVDPANPDTYNIETPTFTLTNPTMAGHAFKGWTIGDSEHAEKQMTITVTQGTTGDLYFNSHWVELVTVEFDPKGGELPIPDAYELEAGSEIGDLPTPTKKGYDFDGWYLGIDKIESDYIVNEDVDLEAHWTPIAYDISYNLDGGSVATANPATYTIEDTVTLNNPTKEHYDFAGWTGTDLSGPTMTVTIPEGTIGNRNYTATWSKKEYTATFKNGDTVVATQTKKYQELFTEPTKPTKTGYRFTGWLFNGESYDFSTPASANIELTAKWTPTNYTIAYNLDGGSVATANPENYNIETDTFTLNNPTKEHYVFAGWTGTDLEEATKTVKVNQGSTGDRAYTATWNKEKYTATFKNGDTVVATQTKEYEDLFTEPTEPTKKGYAFGGWLLDGSPYDFNTPVSEDIELTAKWDIVTYHIYYDLANGTIDQGANPDTYTVESEDITLVNPTMDGHNFKGWKLYGSDEHEPLHNPMVIEKGTTGDLHFIAHWVGLVIVELDSGVDDIIIEPEEIELEQGDALPALPNPTREHYTFDGWYHGTTKIEQGYIVDASMSLLAKWTPVDYGISYDLDGGLVSSANPTTYNIETETFTLNNPTKTGFEFDGWTGTGLTEVTKTVTVNQGSTGNRSYTANWTQLFTVTFDADGGTPAPGNQTIRDGEAATLPTEPTKTDYVFKYWMDANGDEFNFSTSITSNITLTAKWIPARATISTTDTGSDNTLNLKMKQLANPGVSITSGYGHDDIAVKAFKRATEAEYDAIKNTLTNDNIVSTTSSLAPVYMWFDDSDGTMYWYTEAEKVEFVGTMGRLFAKFTALEDISGFADFDTSQVTDMNRILQNCPALTDTIDPETGEVTKKALAPLANWDVSNVTAFRFAFGGSDEGKGMFVTDYSPLSGWNVGKVTDFNQMFKWNKGMEDLSAFKDWNMSSAIDIGNMFTGTRSLTDASDIEKWNVANVSTSSPNGFNNVFSNSGILTSDAKFATLKSFTKRQGTWNKTNGKYTPNP